MKLNRRNFFKNSALGALSLTIFSTASGLFNKAWALVRDDSKVDKQGYMHEWKADGADEKSTKAHGKHVKKLNKEVDKQKLAKADLVVPEGYAPNCANCAQYKKAEDDGFGTCAMVLATGKKDGKFVYKTGWCRVWAIKKKVVKADLGV